MHFVRIIIRETDFVRYPADRLFGHSKSRIPDIRCGRITDIRLSSLSKANYFRKRYVFSLFINSTFVLSNKQQQKMQKNEDRLFVIHKIWMEGRLTIFDSIKVGRLTISDSIKEG